MYSLIHTFYAASGGEYNPKGFNRYYNGKELIQNNNEEQLLASRYLGSNKTIEYRNFLLLPIYVNYKISAMIAFTNYQTKGRIFFPDFVKRILANIVDQLSIQLNLFQIRNRERETIEFFTKLSRFQTDLNVTSKFERNESEDEREEIIKNKVDAILSDLRSVLDPDYLIKIFRWKEDYSWNQLKQILIDASSTDNAEPISSSGLSEFDIIKDYFKGNSEGIKKNVNTNFVTWAIKRNETPYLITILKNMRQPFSKEDIELFSSAMEQIETSLSIFDLRRKSIEIMQNISHQVIAPLRGLESHCINLQENSLGPSHKDYFHYRDPNRKQFVFKLLLSQTSHVRFISQSLKHSLDFDIGNPLKINKNKINLFSILIRTASIYQPIAKEYNISQFTVKYNGIRIDKKPRPFIIVSDELLLFHVFSCMSDNAVKYSYEDTSIFIDVITNTNNREFFYIDFFNKGLIIENDERTSVFERNYRGKESKIEYQQGTGIGLYLVQKIIEAIGGTVYVKSSNKENGNIFRLELPYGRL